MDIFRAFSRRLIVALFLSLAVLCSHVARADDASCYAAGKAQVDRAISNCQAGWAFCQLDGFTFNHDSGNVWVAVVDFHYGNSAPGAAGRQTPTFTCNSGETPTPPDPCKTAQPRTGMIEVDGNATMLGCDGQCSYALTEGTQTSNGLGQSLMVGTWTPTGAHCSTPTPGFDTGGLPQPPRLCSGASCMDTTTGGVCANDKAGNAMCVDGPTATGPGGCSGTANGAICAGPKPPLPVPPQLSQITDPPTEITGSDHYTQQTTNPNSGGLPIVTPINVNTYGVGGKADSPTSSGQTSGDKGPAPASSTGGPQGSYGGGGDCNSPPACTGDPVMCGVARQQWVAMCQQHKDADKLYTAVVGDGKAPDPADPPTTSGFASSLWNTPGSGSGDPIGDAANQGNYDLTGLGFSTTCPLHDMTVPLPDGKSFDIKFSKGCELGGWLKAIIIAFALFAAAKITAGGTG